MAAAIEMDVDQVDSSNKSAANRSSLAISKSSAKISKSALRRPIVSQQTKPMPTSKVYNTDPMGFRNLVQELTGYSPNVEQSPPAAPPPPQQATTTTDGVTVTATKSSASAAVAGGAAAVRPANTRLQRMAPPPLSPAFSFSFKQQQQQQAPDGVNSNAGAVVSPSAHPLSPISKRVSPMPLLSFSPLPQLSPTDNIWANFESPNTAAIKKFAQSIIDGGNSGGNGGGGNNGDNSGAAKMGFPWSPTFQACFGMPSPGIAGIPELFPDVKMMDSPDNFNSSGNSSSREFSFPEIRD